MATDKQLLQWARQGNEIHKAPSDLYWYATVDESNVVTRNLVYDPLFKNAYDANPISNIKKSNENTQIGDEV
jgi:hypothetical protein